MMGSALKGHRAEERGGYKKRIILRAIVLDLPSDWAHTLLSNNIRFQTKFTEED